MGVISTPKAGGTAPRMSLNRGSVGHTATLKGNSFTLVVGYHEMTTRQSMAKENRLRNGSNTEASGCTQGSVSATHMLLVVLRMSTISFPDNIILSCGDFLVKRGVPNDVCVVIGTTLLLRDDEGATNAVQLATRKEIIMLTTKTNFATLVLVHVRIVLRIAVNRDFSVRSSQL
eukprot:CAMPEP_0198292202 /NCGR_PEP_ID=MMETSP1449-20131203/10647_1 /TAXON_ID=420275 /ORGANISM="Attheya septentrionalis, Strain CCMP2084" /LENGTH=173 /DNA_ID=CAMNT_0043990999 /DNA_START=289 /DNA_END=810 /DNA_ORIENTATION=+